MDLSIEETGSTYLENAMIKARALQELVHNSANPLRADTGSAAGRPSEGPSEVLVLADDSGLEVDALGGKPGIYSARYGTTERGGDLGDAGRTQLLLTELGDEANRGAAYHCSVVLIAGRELVAAHAVWPGRIGMEPVSGGTGFGYDPVFIPEDRAEPVSLMSEADKASESHRARAVLRVARAAAAWPGARRGGLPA